MAPIKKNKGTDRKLSRKEQRKQKRKEKKIKRNDYHAKLKKQDINSKTIIKTKNLGNEMQNTKLNKKDKVILLEPKRQTTEELYKKEQKTQRKLQKQMAAQRKKQLLEANIEEDRNIKMLEKQLKLHKRKSKGVPKSFDADGLGYLLEVCDSESMARSLHAEKEIVEANDDFDEDFELMTKNEAKSSRKNTKIKTKKKQQTETIMKGFEDENSVSSSSEVEDAMLLDNDDLDSETEESFEDNYSNDEFCSDTEIGDNMEPQENRTLNLDEDEEMDDVENDNAEQNNKTSDTWEDIYGRLRSKEGEIITTNQEKYIPPALREKTETDNVKKQTEKLNRLRKHLKGLLNRLAESNMHNIASQIEELYRNNSRNDMNDSLTSLVLESLVSNVMTPERLLIEHIMLIAVLHANIGSEIGAHFLQTVVKKYQEFQDSEVECKVLDNLVNIIAQLYNFKLFDSKLVYEILNELSNKFMEKDIECILHILRAVGFDLRKENPLALKDLIFKLQKQAALQSEKIGDNSRIKFMLDVLLAIKNNNVTKIPNYDTTYSEHMKKVMRGLIRKGNYVVQLNITLEDLLKADERGKWWVVGSAWTGNISKNTDKPKEAENNNGFSQKLLELAKKQRLSTDTRKNIFCIIMSAEDYLDAFEKLLKLGLKNQQEREIIHVILHCCLHEEKYNPYYSILAQKFCEYDRKYQMMIKYTIWDKLKILSEHSSSQITNLSKLLIHLFVEKSIPISTLKVVEFSELEKTTLRFVRQILLGILLFSNVEAVQSVFENVAQSQKLKMFRESLRLFIHHFILRNLKSNSIDLKQKSLMETRAKLVEDILISRDRKVVF